MNITDFSQQDLEILKAVATTGVGYTTASGLDAIQLDALAKLAYQIFYPELKKMMHIQPEMAGERWGGQSYQWKSIVAPNAAYLVAPVSPGNRNAISSITSDFYSAPYATLGYDQSVQDEEFEQERGFDDPVKNARITTMHSILQMYDILATSGNRGTASNGFALGAATTPSLVTNAATGGLVPASTKLTVYVVELTAFGASFRNVNSLGINTSSGAASASSALTPFFIRTPANASSSESIPNGVGKPSAALTVTAGGSTSTNLVTVAATPDPGAFAWAWFVSYSGSPTTANSYLTAITQVPVLAIGAAAASSSNQTLAAFETLQGGVDTSYNGVDSTNGSNSPAPEFDGEFAYIAGSNPANFIQMNGLGWTPDSVGGVVELNNAIKAQFLAFQAVPDEIVCGINAIDAITEAVQQGTASNFRFMKGIGADGSVNAGGVIKEYRLKFSATGEQTIIPVSVTSNMPANAVWLPSRYNPFPTTSNTIPANLQLAEIKPMYSARITLRPVEHGNLELTFRPPWSSVHRSSASCSLALLTR
jgi:hypothetical protein